MAAPTDDANVGCMDVFCVTSTPTVTTVFDVDESGSKEQSIVLEESRDEEDDDFDLTPETIAAWEREAATAGGWLPHRLRFEAQVLAVVLFWLLGGGWVYSLLNDDWSYAESVYYASNVGFSIGFGALVETTDESRLFSVLMLMLGASAIGGALGLFVQVTLESTDTTSVGQDETELGVDQDGDGDVDCSDYVAAYQARLRRWFDQNRTRVQVFTVFLVWVATGTAFIMLEDGVNFVTGLYFSTSAMSTAGLYAPTVEEDTGHIKASTAWFVAFFAATGVPLFGLALGQFAGVMVDRYVAAKEEATLKRLVTKDEFDAVKGIYGGGKGSGGEGGEGGEGEGEGDDETLDAGEYLVLELLRLGKVDLGLVRDIHRSFEAYDGDHSGDVSWAEVGRTQKLRAARALQIAAYRKQKRISPKAAKGLVDGLGATRLADFPVIRQMHKGAAPRN
jgi:hypothetical protein